MKDWLKLVLLGVLSVVFGVFVLGAPVVASLAVTTMTGILFLIMGGLQVVGGFSGDGMGQKIFGILMGLIMIFLGWSFLANPLEGTISLALMVVILLAASGIVRLVPVVQHARYPVFLADADLGRAVRAAGRLHLGQL